MNRDLIEDDILIALFVLASEEAGTQFFKASKDDDLQSIFYELKDDHSILNCFVFSEAGPEPYSPTLSDTLTDLQYGNILNWLDHQDAELFRVGKCAEEYFNTKLSFTQEELVQLKKAAKDLAEKLE